MNIDIINKTKQKIRAREMAELAAIFAKKYRLKFSSLAVVFVGRQRIHSLNRLYRRQDRPTDVLSFSPADFPEAVAELILCPAVIYRTRNYREVFPNAPELFANNLSAAKKKKLTEYLLFFVLVHGLLHLAGHDDSQESDRLQMLALGQKFLADQGFLIGQ